MNKIELYRLATLRWMLRLEKEGLKHSSGALRPKIAAEFGLSPRADHEELILVISALISAELDQQRGVMP